MKNSTLDSWYGNDTDIDNIIVNAFFAGDEFCALHPRYVEPQLLSSHTNLGKKKNQGCFLHHGSWNINP